MIPFSAKTVRYLSNLLLVLYVEFYFFVVVDIESVVGFVIVFVVVVGVVNNELFNGLTLLMNELT